MLSNSRKERRMSSNASPSLPLPDFSIPDVMMLEIFLRLPVNSLLRFRCVSKSVRAMIDSQVFIKEHTRRSQKTKYDFQLIFHKEEQWQRSHHLDHDVETLLVLEEFIPLPQPHYVEFWDPFVLEEFIPLPQPHYVEFCNGNSAAMPRAIEYPPYLHIPEMVGCCNGIICLRDRSPMQEGYTLWNPSTRKYKKIESPGYISHTCGFGYDQVKDDYKIMTIDMSESYSMRVYSLKSNSWRKLDKQPPDGYDKGFTNAYVQGAVHWLWTSPSLERKIAAFHLGSETFRFLPLPPCQNSSYPTLIDLEDNLCIVGESFPETDSWTKLRIWVMEEHGNKDSWKTYDMDIRHPSILPNSKGKPAQKHTTPFFLVSREKYILRDEQKSEMFLIDIQKLNDITSQNQLVRSCDMNQGYQICICYKSLVQL